jgi:hypothetical protein
MRNVVRRDTVIGDRLLELYNDKGETAYYRQDIFVTVEEYREQKLQSLLDNIHTMIRSRYEIGKRYLVHNKWKATAIKFKNKYIQNKIIETMGFEFDCDVAFCADKDGLYYFSNDASVVLDIEEIREQKLQELLN